ncbi:MAG: hypothetical protein AAGI38_09315 [Bacteroidota bacterium]
MSSNPVPPFCPKCKRAFTEYSRQEDFTSWKTIFLMEQLEQLLESEFLRMKHLRACGKAWHLIVIEQEKALSDIGGDLEMLQQYVGSRMSRITSRDRSRFSSHKYRQLLEEEIACHREKLFRDILGFIFRGPTSIEEPPPLSI